MKTLSFFFTFLLIKEVFSQTDPSDLENFLPIFRVARLFENNIVMQFQQSNTSPLRRAKFQNRVSETEKFPCDLTNSRSPTKPSSVHKLRPGDIDVIAALGDSLTAGVGATAINFVETPLEERGKSFSIGGEGNWRTYTTLPNILKIFNPNLVGYSLNTALSMQEGSELNVAEGFAISSDMPYMAKQLVRGMKQHQRVNIEEDWKMITIFIGSNDFCVHICYLDDPYSSLEKYKSDMIQTLRLLRDNLPKTLVNLIPAPHMKALVDLKHSDPICQFTQLVGCPCFFGMQFANKRQQLYDVMTKWQKIDFEISDLEEFDRDDFAVVVQPFTVNFTFPTTSGNVADATLLSPDCFHFSQKMHARIANDLWNNVLEPVGRKSFDGNDLFTRFRCPTEEHPYIFTKRNS